MTQGDLFLEAEAKVAQRRVRPGTKDVVMRPHYEALARRIRAQLDAGRHPAEVAAESGHPPAFLAWVLRGAPEDERPRERTWEPRRGDLVDRLAEAMGAG